jgi:uncharacterized protein (DUF2336 family)
LTDLYVQSPVHNDEEQRQYVELASRLIDEVDDATRASIRARLSIYPDTPPSIAEKLGLATPAISAADGSPELAAALAPEIPAPADDVTPTNALASWRAQSTVSRLALQPADALAIDTMFTGASPHERILILRNLEDSPLVPAARGDEKRNARAIATLEKAALASDQSAFATELAGALLLRPDVARRIVGDTSGELLACATKALGAPDEVFQRILLFLKPDIGTVVNSVYRLSRLYETLDERSALIMLAVWRGAMVANTRAKYQPTLYDDERRRARPAATAQHQSAPAHHSIGARSRG